MKSTGIIIRVSTNRQFEGDSPEVHERRARAYAESKGWKVEEIYHLEATSGKSVIEHREIKRMLSDVRRGKIQGIIFSKIARLARNTRELLEIAEFFQEHDATLISLGENIDTSTPIGRMFYTMISALAQWERENIAERIAVSVPIRAKMGKSLGGSAPYGYQYVDGKLAINDDEAPIRKEMYELFLKHRRKATVAKIMNDKGYRTRRGGKFSKQTITHLLKDSVAKGMKKSNYISERSGSREVKPESEWVYQPAPALITSEMWDEVQSIIQANAKPHMNPRNTKTKLFTGYLVCHCGGKMYEPSNNKKYICSKCKHKIPKDDIEAIFKEQLQEFVFSENILERIIDQGGEALNEKKRLLVANERELIKVQAQVNSLIELHSKGQIPTEDFGKHYEAPSTRLKELEKHILLLQSEIDSIEHNEKSVQKIVLEAQDIYSNWDDMERQDKRTIIESIVDRITVYTDEIEISIRSLFASFGTYDKWGKYAIGL